MSIPHDDNSSNSEVLDAHLDAIGALTWKPFETAKRLPQTHTGQIIGRVHASERPPIGSRLSQEPYAEPQYLLEHPRQECRGAGGDGPTQGARQTFGGEIQPRGLEQQRVVQGAHGRPPHQQPVAQSTRIYHLDSHQQRPNLENVHIMEPAMAYRQQHSGWVQVRNHGNQQEQGHYTHAHPGQEHGWPHNGLVHPHGDVYHRQTNYPRSQQVHVPHVFNPEGPWHPNIDRRRGTNHALDRQHRRRGGFKGRGEY